jgi:hypothetical protein
MTLDELERDLYALAEPRPGDDELRVALRTRLAPVQRPRRRRPSSRSLLPAAAAVAAAAVAAAVFLGGNRPPAAHAAVLRRTLAAVTPPAGTILHVKTVDTENGIRFVGEWWQQTDAPYASRGLKGEPGHEVEFADDGRTSYTYDPASNTIYERPDTAAPVLNDPIALVRGELADGKAQFDGTVVIGGLSLYSIKLSSGVVAYVDETSYAPRYIDSPQQNGTTARFVVATYEYLPATAANELLLNEVAQHPDARVDSNPADLPSGFSK